MREQGVSACGAHACLKPTRANKCGALPNMQPEEATGPNNMPDKLNAKQATGIGGHGNPSETM